MEKFDIKLYLKNLYQPSRFSHKGQNGKLLIIGGSHLFHAASLWSLKIASRMVDMVFYSSVPENNEIVQKCKQEFRDGIVVPRNELDHYIKEADCVLIGCGMNRREILSNTNKYYPTRLDSARQVLTNTNQNNISVDPCPTPHGAGELSISVNPDRQSQTNNKTKNTSKSLAEINQLEDEGEQTWHLTRYVLSNYHDKRFVLDAGALQELRFEWLQNLKEPAILTPHEKEWKRMIENNQPPSPKATRLDSARLTANQGGDWGEKKDKDDGGSRGCYEEMKEFVEKFNVIVLLKGVRDQVFSKGKEIIQIEGGVPGMTKGGTGDVLAGVIAALYCKNDALTSTVVGSYFNKKAGEDLAARVGNFFNASDLVDQLPETMKRELGK